jgi:hypothetical protein
MKSTYVSVGDLLYPIRNAQADIDKESEQDDPPTD